MITAKNIGIGLVVLGALFGFLGFFGIHLGGSQSFGAINNGALVQNYPYWFTNSTGSGNVLYAGKSQQFAVTDAGALTAGAATLNGNLTVTTSNTATSTITVGCFQSYATSTATSLALRFTASTTAPTNGSGVIPVVSYGTCP